MGCALIGMFIIMAAVTFAVLGLYANSTGLIHHTNRPGWILAGILALLFFSWFFIWGRRSFRRLSIPLLDLFKASGRVAEGDYSVRIKEQGPPEVRALVRAFNSMAARLKTADEQRRSLLADVTHELRTPLTVIHGNLEGILDGIYEADEAHLRSILDEVQILSRLVDDLRTLALAESGALRLHKEATDLAILVKDVGDAFRSQADDRGVVLRISSDSGLPAVQLDGERMHQVLSNLIANALRYTPTGGMISLHCAKADERNGEEHAVITVEDSGPGIKAEDLPYVFARFYKASDSGGMGLGLAIVKNIVEAHGGKVGVESQEGKGTKFTIDLPISLPQ